MKPMTTLLLNGIADKIAEMPTIELDYLARQLAAVDAAQAERLKNALAFAQQENDKLDAFITENTITFN